MTGKVYSEARHTTCRSEVLAMLGAAMPKTTTTNVGKRYGGTVERWNVPWRNARTFHTNTILGSSVGEQDNNNGMISTAVSCVGEKSSLPQSASACLLGLAADRKSLCGYYREERQNVLRPTPLLRPSSLPVVLCL